jgi:shikimate dehydrogenase
VSTFFATLGERGFSGCNVTLPHKQAALAAAQHKEAVAVTIGAANTLWLEDGKLCATNTDAYGFMTHLALSAPGWDRRDAPVAVLGAGGAARAIVYGLLEAGVSEVRLSNRTNARAEEMARAYGPRVKAYSWSERATCAADAGLLVNTTSLGMVHAEPLDMDLAGLRNDTVVVDIVYVPLETDLLARARKRGLRVVDGLGMLLYQAVPGFEKWFGVKPEVTHELRAKIVADIEGC